MAEFSKYTYEFISKRFTDNGYFLISTEYNGEKKELVFKDSDGYLYSTSYDLFRGAIKRKQKILRFSKRNKYSINNINKYLKDNNLSFSCLENQIFTSTKEKLSFLCNICNDVFYNSWHNVYYNNIGCLVCSSRHRQLGKSNSLYEKFPQILCEWDYNKNNVSPLDIIYTSRVKVYWNCPNGHNYFTSIYQRVKQGTKCPYCCKSPRPTKCRNFAILYSELLKEWNYIKNNELKIFPDLIAPYSNKRVWWICIKCGYEWMCAVKTRTALKRCCPRCCESKGEKIIGKILDKYNIEYIREKVFSDCKITTHPLSFDFFIPDKKIICEYQGIQHFKPIDFAGKGEVWADDLFKKNQIRDTYKQCYCENNGFKLIEIPYWEFNNIENILRDVLHLGEEV